MTKKKVQIAIGLSKEIVNATDCQAEEMERVEDHVRIFTVIPKGYSMEQVVETPKIISAKENNTNQSISIRNTCSCQEKTRGYHLYLPSYSFLQDVVIFSNKD